MLYPEFGARGQAALKAQDPAGWRRMMEMEISRPAARVH
jgi:hypothetical protein